MDSKITTNMPAQGLSLKGRWYLDCCLNLGQKLDIVDALHVLGYSRDFIQISKRFVEGRPIAEANLAMLGKQRQQKSSNSDVF
jgi:hypothetical protein